MQYRTTADQTSPYSPETAVDGGVGRDHGTRSNGGADGRMAETGAWPLRGAGAPPEPRRSAAASPSTTAAAAASSEWLRPAKPPEYRSGNLGLGDWEWLVLYGGWVLGFVGDLGLPRIRTSQKAGRFT